MKRLICFAMVCCLCAGAAEAKRTSPYVKALAAARDAGPAPVPWGTPLAGGPLRVLFIAPLYTLRDAANLARRLEMDWDTAPVLGTHTLGSDDPACPDAYIEQVRATLEQRLAENWDVIVIGNVDAAILPEDAAARIVQAVAAGTGLVLANAPDAAQAPDVYREFLGQIQPAEHAETITRGVGEALTPEWPSSLDFVKPGLYEKGRVVRFEYPGGAPETHCLLPALAEPLRARPEFLDTYLSLVARAVRWAGGREPALGVARVTEAGPEGPSEDEIPPGLPDEYIQTLRDSLVKPLFHSFQIELDAPAPKPLRVVAQVREPNRGLRADYPGLPVLPKGAQTCLVELPVGPGRYFLDLWFLDGKKVVEWHTDVITTTGWPEFTNLAFSKGYLLANDALTVSLDIRPHLGRPRPAAVYVRAVDSLGRIVAEGGQPVPPEGGPARVTLQFADLIANLVKVEIFAADAPGPQLTRWDLDRAAYGFIYLPVRAPRPPREYTVAAEARALGEYNARATVRALMPFGVSALAVPATADARFYAAEMNLRPIPELTRYVVGETGAPAAYPLDPEARKSEAERLRSDTTAFWTVGTSVYSLGNGNRLAVEPGALLESAEWLQGFRAWLMDRYPAVEDLNRAWATTLESWDAVTPEVIEPVPAAGVFAPWLDYRRFLDAAFAQLHAEGRETVQAVDRDGRTGFCAATPDKMVVPYDWASLAPRLTALALYPDPLAVEEVRSYLPPFAPAALVLPHRPGAPASWSHWMPWYQVLHGFSGVWLTGTCGAADADDATVSLEPGGRPSPETAAAASRFHELGHGLGALLLAAGRAHPRIAIYGSPDSRRLHEANAPFETGPTEAALAALDAIESLGYQSDFVCPDMARQGKLLEYALLVMPMVRVLDDAEVEAVREFCARGGSLLVDIAPGECDGHGRRRQAMPLDDLLAVQHSGPPVSGPPTDVTVQLTAGAATASAALPGICADTAASAVVGTPAAAGGAPVWVAQFGEAAVTVVLNHPFPAPGSPAARGFQDLLRFILEQAGLAPAAPFKRGKNGEVPGECIALQFGSAEIYAVLRGPGGAGKRRPCELALGSVRAAYDLRAGKRIMNPRRFRAKLAPGDAAVCATLPYVVDELALTAMARVRAGERLMFHLAIQAKDAAPGNHLVHVELARSSGQPIAHYCKEVVCMNGAADSFIPLALNEEPGSYLLLARDVLTGVSSQALVYVASPPAPVYRPPVGTP